MYIFFFIANVSIIYTHLTLRVLKTTGDYIFKKEKKISSDNKMRNLYAFFKCTSINFPRKERHNAIVPFYVKKFFPEKKKRYENIFT